MSSMGSLPSGRGSTAGELVHGRSGPSPGRVWKAQGPGSCLSSLLLVRPQGGHMPSEGLAQNTVRDVSFLTQGPAREKHAGAGTLPGWPRIQSTLTSSPLMKVSTETRQRKPRTDTSQPMLLYTVITDHSLLIQCLGCCADPRINKSLTGDAGHKRRPPHKARGAERTSASDTVTEAAGTCEACLAFATSVLLVNPPLPQLVLLCRVWGPACPTTSDAGEALGLARSLHSANAHGRVPRGEGHGSAFGEPRSKPPLRYFLAV